MNNWRNICQECAQKLDVHGAWYESSIVSTDPEYLCENCWEPISKVGQLSDVHEDVIAWVGIRKKGW